MPDLRREPPAAVRRELRREVGFGCPVDDCGSPYLTWHHFEPQWAERPHHDPDGMVALCRDCHPQADAGAFTPDQLRAFKHRGRDRRRPLGGRINWMRQQLVAVVGGNFYVDTPVAVQVQNLPVVWFSRDEEGYVLVNLQQLTTSREPRMLMLDNFWMTEGATEHDIECPPSGRIVRARYPNGDSLDVEFQSHDDWDEFERRFPTSKPPPEPEALKRLREQAGIPPYEAPRHRDSVDDMGLGLEFPLTTVAVKMRIAGTGIDLGSRASKFGGVTVTGGWMVRCGVGVQIGPPGLPTEPA